MLNKVNEWDKNNRVEFFNKFSSEQDFNTFVNSMKKDNIHLAFTDNSMESVDKSEAFQADTMYNPIFSKIYQQIRPRYNDRSSVTGNFIINQSADHIWTYTETANLGVFTLNPVFGQEFSMNKIVLKKVNFMEQYWLYILIITAISVIILLKFLSFTLDKIYGFRYKKYADRSGDIDTRTFTTYFLNPEYFSNNSSYNNIFIVGINSSNTSNIKNYLIKHYTGEFFTLDFYDFDEKTIELKDNASKDIFNLLKLDRLKADWEKIKEHFNQRDKRIYILIEHFEYGYNDVQMNKLKLEALKYLVDCEHFKVLISSEINATKLLDFYEDSMKRLDILLKKSNVENRLELQEELDNLKIDFKKWQHLLGSFVKCIIPIKKFPQEEELAQGEFLDMVSKYLGFRKNHEIPEDDKILTIQQMSYPYYFSIWNSLSKDERYIIYDIARDRFVNTINTNGIMSLLDKGILVYDHSLRIMNESFSNFVLTKVNSDEALEMEMESRKKGTWNTVFAVLFLLIISLVVFLSIGQQNFLNDLNAFLTAIVALVGLLIRFSGFLSFGGGRGASA